MNMKKIKSPKNEYTIRRDFSSKEFHESLTEKEKVIHDLCNPVIDFSQFSKEDVRTLAAYVERTDMNIDLKTMIKRRIGNHIRRTDIYYEYDYYGKTFVEPDE